MSSSGRALCAFILISLHLHASFEEPAESTGWAGFPVDASRIHQSGPDDSPRPPIPPNAADPTPSGCRHDDPLGLYVRVLTGGDQPWRGLVGRLLRGRADHPEEDFESLTPDSSRRIVFLMGADGLAAMLNCGGSGRRMLRQLGYTQEEIDDEVKAKTALKLVVFHSQPPYAALLEHADSKNLSSIDSGQQAVLLATWENLFKLIKIAYSEVYEKLHDHLPLLKRTPFEKIDTPFDSFEEVRKRKSGPHYIDEQRLKSMAREEVKLWHVRAFLLNVLHLNAHYGGDGFTYVLAEGGGEKRRTNTEFVTLNRPLSSIGPYRLIDVNVTSVLHSNE